MTFAGGWDGYKKILDTCAQAKRDGYQWVWVDACYIDKRSSTELSEATDSMYRWCANSRVCYVYPSTTPMTPFPLGWTAKNIPSQMAGQSGFRAGGRCRR